MDWTTMSIVLNIVLGVVLVIFALDRRFFRQTCQLRHNPIDEAIARIEAKLTKVYDMLVDHITGGKK